jgi:flavorubredoxin
MKTELKPGVYWVGAVDWGLRHFHGFELSTHRGSTYNAYLIVDEKIALVDTVWAPFQEDLLRNIRDIVDPARIDYVVTNHSESDHSGALPLVMRHASRATVVVSKRGVESLQGHYHHDWPVQAVKTGDRLKLGREELLFVEAPMLHWPDSMFTYLTQARILMPNDAFGQHYATAFRFNDQVNPTALYEEALKYYANIVSPFASFVTKKIAEFASLNLPVDIIAPSHGVIWRQDPMQIVTRYAEWAAQKPEPTAVVLFDTMWNATRLLAEAIGRGLARAGVEHKLFFMPTADRNDVITEVFKTRAVIIGSPTFNKGLLAGVLPILDDLRGHRFQNKIGAAFGSFGWSGEGVKLIEKALDEAGIPLAAEGLSVKWQPDAAALEQAEKLGEAVAAAVRK